MAVESIGSKKVPRRTPVAAAHASAGGAAGQRAPDGPAVAVAPNRFLPIAPQTAEELNDDRPLADRPLQEPAPTYLPTAWDNLARETARRCLATAVYYEAAGEGWHGELAVAQVILNRVRHPAYPKSICGVVYQGSNLPTGCQFTFTCDGRLARPPSPAGWKQAMTLAEAALSGAIEPRVGLSTHYHTRQVVPYWAGSLDKLAVLGNHIFYTFAGPAGSRRAFTGRLLADAAPPGADLLRAGANPVVTAQPVGLWAGASAVQVVPEVRADARVTTRLAADERGTLTPSGGTLLRSDAQPSRLRADERTGPQ